MNTTLLRRIAEHIKEEPRRLEMNSWFTDVRSVPEDQRPPCGTVACIAGWAMTLSDIDEVVDPFCQGKKLLGLTEPQAARLFFTGSKYGLIGGSWPDQFSEPYLRARTAKSRARITVARIEHFIATKGKE